MNTSSCWSSPIKLAATPAALSPQLATLLALQRAEEPETPVLIEQVEPKDLLATLECGRYDFAIGWAGWASSANRFCSEHLLWRDALAAALPSRSPLLMHGEIPAEALRRYSLVYWCPQSCREHLNHQIDTHPESVETSGTAASFELMAVLVAAGYAIGIAPQSRIARAHASGVLMRPLAGAPQWVETNLFRPIGSTSPAIERFFGRARKVASAGLRSPRMLATEPKVAQCGIDALGRALVRSQG